MRRILLLILCQFGLFADVVTLTDGHRIDGLVQSGNTQELSVKVGDRSQTIDIHQIATIQFAASLSAASPKTAAAAPAGQEPAAAQPNTLILSDGTHVPGRLWSIDAGTIHYLVENQLQQYPRSRVAAVTFGNATLPTAPAPSTPPAPSAQRPAPAPAAPAASTPAQSEAPPPRPATVPRPSANAQPPASTGARSQPDEIGMVYNWNGRVVIPLERNQAVERKSGSAQYWEIPGARARVRLAESSTLVFVVGLPEGIAASSYSLFPLDTMDGARRTRSQAGRRGGLLTWPVEIVKQHDATISTYVFTVTDLPAGEYSFSPSNSNESYCFGVDPAAPGQ